MLNAFSPRFKFVNPLFLLTVALPTTISIIYFGLIASGVYVSESRFIVRAAEKQAAPSVSNLLKGSMLSEATTELFAVKDYAVSRDALRALNRDGSVVRAYSRPEIDFVDRYNSFGFSKDYESLFRHYKSHIEIAQDPSSSITILRVRAYTPEDAHLLNERLLDLSEGLVNKLNVRNREDMIRFAKNEVEGAQREARTAALALAAYRNRSNVLDPEKQGAAQLQVNSELQGQLIAAKAQLAQVRASAPRSPSAKLLEARIAQLNMELASQTQRLAGGTRSLAGVAADYQRVALDSTFAEKALTSALASLEVAQNDARRKQVYIERIVQPHLPDDDTEPRRLRSIFATFALGMVVWGILTMLLAGLREHND